MREQEIHHVISRLLPNNTFNSIVISSINAGRNNRAYHVQLDEKDYFLKHYNPAGERNRLQSEYQFITYANSVGSSYVVKPIAHDPELSCGLYEYQHGERYLSGEISDSEINHAIHFLKDLNDTRSKFPIMNVAQEACFSISKHIDHIDKRVQLLNSIIVTDDIDRHVLHFVNEKLKPAWLLIKQQITETCDKKMIVMDKLLCDEDRLISPSDFGFHNALRLPNNKIIFVDFEYAGWDDPAKLIGDFFNQIEVPISRSYFSIMVHSVSKLIKNQEEMLDRTEILLPIYCIKWCCIILNYFLPSGRITKSFSSEVTRVVRENQLQKAKNRLLSLCNTPRIAINE